MEYAYVTFYMNLRLICLTHLVGFNSVLLLEFRFAVFLIQVSHSNTWEREGGICGMAFTDKPEKKKNRETRVGYK